jgi:hypothetical protein
VPEDKLCGSDAAGLARLMNLQVCVQPCVAWRQQKCGGAVEQDGGFGIVQGACYMVNVAEPAQLHTCM